MPDTIRITSFSSMGSVTIDGLTQREVDALRHAFSAKCSLVGVNQDGRLDVHDRHEPLPEPQDDPPMYQFWSGTADRFLTDSPKPPKTFDFSSIDAYSSPAIVIQHLCGYNYTPNNYKAQCQLLQSYGFACLRSRRGQDGQFWEIWYLPGLWSATGDLAFHMSTGKHDNDSRKLQRAVEFLRSHASFGTLDICCQRLACVVD